VLVVRSWPAVVFARSVITAPMAARVDSSASGRPSMVVRTVRIAFSSVHTLHRSVPGPAVTIMSEGYFCTDADSSSAKSRGIGIGWLLPSPRAGIWARIRPVCEVGACLV
jgi:hypothetical protein